MEKDLIINRREAPSAGADAPRRILVHICCGPCSLYPIKAVLGGASEVCGFFHNTNIHPLSEFKRRLASVKTLSAYLGLNVIYDEEYRPTTFIKEVKRLKRASAEAGRMPQKSIRCPHCYNSRLDRTARAARDGGFDAFTSSLLYSRSQDHARIIASGREAAERNGVEFYYEDFRKGWQAGLDESKAIGLYRQRYCGCIYSRIERNTMAVPKKTVKAALTEVTLNDG